MVNEFKQEAPAALVTGASRGIGRAIALKLASNGHPVVVHYNQDKAAAEAVISQITAAGGQAIALQADLGASDLSEDWLAPATQIVGPIRLLAHSAGMCTEDMAAFQEIGDFDRTLAVNLRSAALLAQALLPGMLKARRGALVFIGSEAGRWGSPGLSAYAASKAGLEGYMRALAQEVGPRNVRVNLLSPGLVETDMLAAMPAEQRKAIAARTALGRLATSEEVADAAAFLLSAQARFITGATLIVDGGLRHY